MKEIWKPVRGKEDYAEVSNLGQIHYYAGKSMKYPDERWTYGYETGDYLYACIGGVSKGVHVWVYMTFNDCDIPKGYDVNHLDENKHNNRLNNLNLLSHGDNIRYGTGIERMADSHRGMKHSAEAKNKMSEAHRGKYNTKISKPVQALDTKTLEVVMEFPSTREAKRQGFDASAVSACCRNCYSTHKGNVYKGFIWRHKFV